MPSFYTYLLKCKDKSLYCGYTNNLENRLEKHQKGKASKYTTSRLPVQLVYKEKHTTKSKAMKREAQIKKMKRNQKLFLIKLKPLKTP